ncbi:MAG: hypothetical protein ABI171_23870 [Collimonas sp.]
MNLLVGFQDGVDDGHERPQCRRNRGRRSPVARWRRELVHFLTVLRWMLK